MAITLTAEQLRTALRITDPDETGEITRLLAVYTEVVQRYSPDAPSNIANEALIRLAAYVYDKPNAPRGTGYSKALANSGAGGLLLPYRVHRAGSVSGGTESTESTPSTGLTPSTPSTQGVDQVARDTANDALNKANMALTDIAELIPLIQAKGDPIPKATNTLVDQETDDTAYTTVRKVYRAIDRRVKNASQTVRGIVQIARNQDIDNEDDLSRVPNLSGAIRLWRRLRNELREVPSVPDTANSVTEKWVLTVFGRNDKNYRWERPSALGGGTDQTARDSAEAAQTTADRADAKAVTAQETADAAQLEADTVIQVGPAFVVGEKTQRNLYISIVHPLNAYRNANIISVSVQGQTPNLQAYNPNTLQAEYTVGLTTTQMNNIATQGHFTEGNFILVDIRLRQGRNGPVQFFRNVYVPVVAAVSGGGGITQIYKKTNQRVFNSSSEIDTGRTLSADAKFLVLSYISPDHYNSSPDFGHKTLWQDAEQFRAGANNTMDYAYLQFQGTGQKTVGMFLKKGARGQIILRHTNTTARLAAPLQIRIYEAK